VFSRIVLVLESAGNLVQNRAVKDLLLGNELNPAKKCWYVLWPMLTKLVERFDPYQYRVRDKTTSVAGPLEHEDEDDDEHEDD
jgi:hypothetical protein